MRRLEQLTKHRLVVLSSLILLVGAYACNA